MTGSELAQGGMATALSIDSDQAPPSCHFEEDPDLCVRFLSTKQNGGISASARMQEIFLDCVGLLASQHNVCYVLDDRFDSFLTHRDHSFKQTVVTFIATCRQQQQEGDGAFLAFHRIEDFLRRELGFERLDEKNKIRLDKARPMENECASLTASNTSSQANIPKQQANTTKKKITANVGHVFCINGSVCDLACDAFLCPAAIPRKKTKHALTGQIFGQWRYRQVHHYPAFWNEMQTNTKHGEKKFLLKRYEQYPNAATFSKWPWHAFASGTLPAPLPLPVFGQVSFPFYSSQAPSQEAHVDQLVRTLCDVLEVALLELREHKCHPQHSRERYLIAVPVLGTGGGGATDLTGQVTQRTLEVLNEYAITKEIDCALVCADPATYAQAQQIRFLQKDMYAGFQTSFINETLQSEAERLALLASKRQLSLFLGAGVSVGSGLPTWFQLLQLLEDDFTANGLPEERTLGDTHEWNPLAMADALEGIASQQADRHGKSLPLKERIQVLLESKSRNPGLLLYLLLALDTPSIVTQNYDQLIERAVVCRNIRGGDSREQRTNNLSVIPYKPQRGASQWLLKMHGCVWKPKDLVLTGRDYERYEAGRLRALSGLVQANLMTSHFLFCGFSMTDPNYLRILGEVRHALKPDIS